jgi:plastocyanin
MRTTRAAAAIALLLLLGPPPAAADGRIVACSTGDVPLFAGAGTPLTNGYFFPGTAVYDGTAFRGAPLVVPQGCNIRFVNLDDALVTNGHEIVSFGRRHGRPLFKSGVSNGPGTLLIKTSQVRPGLYPYYCVIHYSMYGLLQVVATARAGSSEWTSTTRVVRSAR